MKTYIFKAEQFISKDIKTVFDFFKKPENLARITPGSLGFRILTPSPIKMEKGRLIDYTVKILGIRQRWTTLITEYDPPHCFVDEQLKGPYSFWHHKHTFEAADGGTVIKDEVRYCVPFGILGRLLHAFIIRRQIESIFAFRKKVIEEFLE